AGKKLRDFFDAVIGSLGCCHVSDMYSFSLARPKRLCLVSCSSTKGDSPSSRNASRRRPVITVVDRINPAHRFLPTLLFNNVRHQSVRTRNYENAVECGGIHS